MADKLGLIGYVASTFGGWRRKLTGLHRQRHAWPWRTYRQTLQYVDEFVYRAPCLAEDAAQCAKRKTRVKRHDATDSASRSLFPQDDMAAPLAH